MVPLISTASIYLHVMVYYAECLLDKAASFYALNAIVEKGGNYDMERLSISHQVHAIKNWWS